MIGGELGQVTAEEGDAGGDAHQPQAGERRTRPGVPSPARPSDRQQPRRARPVPPAWRRPVATRRGPAARPRSPRARPQTRPRPPSRNARCACRGFMCPPAAVAARSRRHPGPSWPAPKDRPPTWPHAHGPDRSAGSGAAAAGPPARLRLPGGLEQPKVGQPHQGPVQALGLEVELLAQLIAVPPGGRLFRQGEDDRGGACEDKPGKEAVP
jgi:hypothetical protein